MAVFKKDNRLDEQAVKELSIDTNFEEEVPDAFVLNEIDVDELPDVVVEWPSIFDGLTDEERSMMVQRLADAYIGELEREPGDDDELINNIVDEAGYAGLVAVLRTVEGTPRMLAGVLSGGLFLTDNADRIVSVTRYKKADIEDEAATANTSVLHGDLAGARDQLAEAISNLYRSLDYTMAHNKRHKRIRSTADTLLRETSQVLAGIDAPLPGTSRLR